MGKKFHNAKARQQKKVIIDNSSLKDVKLDTAVFNVNSNGYDDANALVLPSKKRTTKVQVERKQPVKILTKKQRKHLQSIVDKKKKKASRANVLEALAKVQIQDKELNQYLSISQVQTVGVRKLPQLDELLAKKSQRQANSATSTEPTKINSIRGAAKRKMFIEDADELARKRKNPNIVHLADDYESSTTESSDNENEDEHNPSDCKGSTIETIQNDSKTCNDPDVSSKSSNESNVNTSKTNKDKQLASNTVHNTAAIHIPVDRDPSIQAARLKLPILGEEQQIMEVINENRIIILAGETGSGKTTQIPQFLYEAGYTQNGKMIGITEPRRVAAIAMSKRVAKEMNLSEREVSYLIRFEGNTTAETKIKFMTDGVLLKEIESDFLLKNYSVIILDEAHERSVYTDILIGLLSRIVPLREKRHGNSLKLIIMSATLRVEDFTSNSRLFKIPPPVVKVEARQFPVTVHFQKHTPDDYVEEAYRKTVKIHSQLPEGGILIFLTGQQEVNHLVRKLRRTFPYNPTNDKPAELEKEKSKASHSSDDDNDELFDIKWAIRNINKSKKRFLTQLALPKIDLDDYKLPGDDTEVDLLEMDEGEDAALKLENNSDEDDDEENERLQHYMNERSPASANRQPLWVLPLYSLLSTEKQNRIFQTPPEGCRLCIVSTNVAETSLTIPNIKYVVDCGRQKTRLYDKITGVSTFVVTLISKASANQRAGRAGRVSAGHCYRLYSSGVFNDEFKEFSQPDIQMKPVDDLMLQMRCMGIDRVINFPFPSPPDVQQLESAEKRLIILGALEESSNSIDNGGKQLPPMVTHLGRVISNFPVAPKFGKMLALSHQQNLLPYTVCLVAALSVQEVLLEANYDGQNNCGDELITNKWRTKRLSWASSGHYQLLGDPMVLLRAVGGAEYAGSKGNLIEFCTENGLRLKAITEIRKLRVQLTNEINLNINNVELCVDPAMLPPTETQARFLRQILLTGMGDKVAMKVPLADINDKEAKRRLKYAYYCLDMEQPAFIHSNSVLRQKLPDWVIYQEAYEIQNVSNGSDSKMFIRGITAIEPEWLLMYVPALCNITAVKEFPLPSYKASEGKVFCYVEATYGRNGWQLPPSEIEMPISEKAFCYFGMFFLDGQVCPAVEKFKAKLKVTPPSMVKSWSNLNQNIVRFKKTLINKAINTKQKLLDEWEENPNFLLEEYHDLLYDVSLTELMSIWPPCK